MFKKHVKHLQRVTVFGFPAADAANQTSTASAPSDQPKQRFYSKARAWQSTPSSVTLAIAKQPTISGHLYWLDTQGTHVWTRRWCILGAGGLHTFESADGNCLATGSLCLADWKVKRWSGQLLHGKEYFGELVHNAYFSEFFAAETAEELNHWLEQLQSVTREPISEINVPKEEPKQDKSPEVSPRLEQRNDISRKTDASKDPSDILRILKQRLLTEVLQDKMEIETRQRRRLKDRRLFARKNTGSDESDSRTINDPDDVWRMRLKRTSLFLKVEDTRRHLSMLREQATKKKRRINMPLMGHLRRSDDTSAAREAELHVHLAELQHELALIDALIDVQAGTQADIHQAARATSCSDNNARQVTDAVGRRNGLTKRGPTANSFDFGKGLPERRFVQQSVESENGVQEGDVVLTHTCNEIVQMRDKVTRDRPRSAILLNDKKAMLSYTVNLSHGSWPRNLATILPRQKRQPPERFFGEQNEHATTYNVSTVNIASVPSSPQDDSAPTSPTDHPPLRRLANTRVPTIRRSGSQPVSVVAPLHLRDRTKTLPIKADSVKQLQQAAHVVKLRRTKADVRKRRESPADQVSPIEFHEIATADKQRRQPSRSHSFDCRSDKKTISRSRPVSFSTLHYETKRRNEAGDYATDKDGCCNLSLNSSSEDLERTFCRGCMSSSVRSPTNQHSPHEWFTRPHAISDSSATTSPELTRESPPRQRIASSMLEYIMSDNGEEKAHLTSKPRHKPPALSLGCNNGSPPSISSPRCGLSSPSMGKIAEESLLSGYADSTSGDSLLSENSKCPQCGVSVSEQDGSQENVASRSDDGNGPVISTKALAHIAAFEEFIDHKLMSLTATRL